MAGPRPWHVPLVAMFPVAFLLAQNVEEAGVGEALPGLAVTVTAAAAAWGLCWLMFRNARRAGLVASGLVTLTFAYGPVSRWLAGLGSVGQAAGRHRYLLPLWGLLAAGLVWGLARLREKHLGPSTRWLNMASAILVAINVVPVAAYHVGGGGRAGPAIEDIRGTVPPAAGPAGPDVYYLVFDRYGGLDALQEEFGFDNAPFLAELERRGFSVATESRANYPTTVLSLASSLNMAYLDPLSRAMGPGATDREPLAKLIRDHAVGGYLKTRGYRYVHVGSWWEPTSASPLADRSERYGGLSEFSQVLLDQTALAPILRRLSPDLDMRRREYERVLFQFDRVADAAGDRRPTFVFAHFLIPHGPYVFRADGSFRAERVRRGRKQGYLGQLRYVNGRILSLVDRLLAGADDPIIILQADEGPFNGPGNWRRATASDARKKFSILNAYHLPGRGPAVPPGLSPVNSFRMVFDRYLGAELATLPDRSFAPASAGDFYTFLDVTDIASAPPP
jgi:hypothetical protein